MAKNPGYDRFAFYNQNEGLLIQYALHECIAIARVLSVKPTQEGIKALIGEGQPHLLGFKQGHIEKLKNFTTLFEPASPALVQAVDQLLEPTSFDGPALLSKTWKKLRSDIKKVARIIFDQIFDSQHAFVLLYLLKKRNEIDGLFGQPVVLNKISSVFEGGLEEAGVTLSERLNQKGFGHLANFVQKKLRYV